MENINQLRLFFETLKNFTFWQRIFQWKTIRQLSFSAWEEWVQLNELLKNTVTERNATHADLNLITQERNMLLKQTEELRLNLTRTQSAHEGQLLQRDTELRQIQTQLRSKEDTLLTLNQTAAKREQEFQQRLEKAIAMQEIFEKEKNRIQEEEVQKVKDDQTKQKETWANHEKQVKQTMMRLCDKLAIEYLTDFPHKGKPDNVIRIADELIIFDAKSPASDDLSNFRTYLKSQAESASKYANISEVRKDIYLVVPSNTYEVIDTRSYNLAHYNVYVVTLDALEPILIALKQIEEYDFVDQLSPEERQSISRIIGGLIHASKRRIQVDQFFNGYLMELITRVQRELPESMQTDIASNEKAMKLNPPTDKRSREINADKLLSLHQQLGAQAAALDAPTPKEIELAV